jgi:hypothetical protein
MISQEHQKVVVIKAKDNINEFYKLKASNKRRTCLWQKLSLHQWNYGIRNLDIWIIKVYYFYQIIMEWMGYQSCQL